jgi:SAM-dependent methyltransferase
VTSPAGRPRRGYRAPEGYTLGNSPGERHRLHQQLAVLRSHSTALLDRVGLQPGDSAVDLGCGPAGILDLLSARVGPTGHVTGVDQDHAHAAAARIFAREQALANVQILQADARRTGLPGGTFDLVHARLVLVNVNRPAEVVAEMARLAKPGGRVVALEADILGLYFPSDPAVDRVTELLMTSYRHHGADPHLGRRLPHLFRSAGLADIGVEARTDVYPAGHPQRTVLADLLRAIRPKIAARGLVTGPELDTLDAAARRHLADPDTLTVPVTYFLAWARKPWPEPQP